MTRRAIVYIDYENAYRNARDFFHNGDPGDDRTNRHFKPRALAEVLCERYSAMFPARESLNLEAVRVFRGRPVPRYEAAAASAWRRQAEAWEAEGVSITHIPLHYDPQGRGREKGVDILLALHLVMDAVGETAMRPSYSPETAISNPFLEWSVASRRRALSCWPAGGHPDAGIRPFPLASDRC